MASALGAAAPLNPELFPPTAPTESVLRELLQLALPVWAEQVLHMLVGLNDTYLANHLPDNAASAGAAVGTITYFLWFIGLLVASIGAGKQQTAPLQGTGQPVIFMTGLFAEIESMRTQDRDPRLEGCSKAALEGVIAEQHQRLGFEIALQARAN